MTARPQELKVICAMTVVLIPARIRIANKRVFADFMVPPEVVIFIQKRGHTLNIYAPCFWSTRKTPFRVYSYFL
jgi:hypothetical protein